MNIGDGRPADTETVTAVAEREYTEQQHQTKRLLSSTVRLEATSRLGFYLRRNSPARRTSRSLGPLSVVLVYEPSCRTSKFSSTDFPLTNWFPRANAILLSFTIAHNTPILILALGAFFARYAFALHPQRIPFS